MKTRTARHYYNYQKVLSLGRRLGAQLPKFHTLRQCRDALGLESTQAAEAFASATLGRVALALRLAVRNAELRSLS